MDADAILEPRGVLRRNRTSRQRPLRADHRIRRTIEFADGKQTAPIAFLDAPGAGFKLDEPPRAALARWITSPDNPYFAQAMANRVWGQLVGRGIVDPVDDFHAGNPASHPELLDDLAKAFAKSGFDLTVLERAICLTEAYQRTSRHTNDGQDAPSLFARMPIKRMSGDQLFECFTQALGQDDGNENARSSGRSGRDALRRQIVDLFGTDGAGDPETSVSQALTLMNGRLVGRATAPRSSPILRRILDGDALSDDDRLDELYLATLSRFPTSDERRILREHLGPEDDAERPRRLGDVFWALLNSAEFRWNH